MRIAPSADGAGACGSAAGPAPHFLFLRRRENGPLGGPKEKNGGRARPCGRDLRACAGCAWALGNRDDASPHLGAWVRLSGWLSHGLFLFPRSSLRLALPGRQGRADSRSMERQRRENAGQIGFAARRMRVVRRGLHACSFSKTEPAPNAAFYPDCSFSLVGTPRFKQKRR